MIITRYNVQACCGRTAIIFKIDQPLSKIHIDKLVTLGFIELTHFTQSGILYLNNADFILTGPIGSDRLTVKCKHAECSEKLNNLENLLKQV